MDVTALYDNIPNKEGIDSLGAALEERKDPNVPTGLIERMMEVVFDCNLFEFIEDIFMVKRVDKKIIISIYFWTHHAE